MINKKIKNLIQKLKSFKLSEKDNELLRYRISEFMAFNPIREEINIHKKPFYFSIFTFRNLSKGVALVLVAILVVGGTSVSYASTDALPGDALYPIKINIKENIEEKLALTTEAKVVVQSAKVERRLTEAKALSDKKELSPEKEQIVNKNLKKNVASVTKTIQTLKDDGDIELALDTTSKITPVLEAHREVLVENKIKKEEEDVENKKADFETKEKTTENKPKETSENSENDTLLETVDKAIKQVEDVENQVIEKATENKASAEKVTEQNTVSVGKKIEDIKKATAVKHMEKVSKDANITASTKTETSVETSSATSPSAMLKTESALSITTEQIVVTDPKVVEKATAQIVAEEDLQFKLKVAEELIKKADEEKLVGNYKEALRLSQVAKKIIQQIEEYNKIKDAETTTVPKEEVKPSIETIKNNQPQVKEAVKTEATTLVEIKQTLPVKTPVTPMSATIDLEAQAIKSIQETSESFKKLNFNQEAQTRPLLQ